MIPSFREHWKIYLENAWYVSLMYIAGYMSIYWFGWENSFGVIDWIDSPVFIFLTIVYTKMDIKKREKQKA